MKKVSLFLISAIVIFCSCSKPLYPNQSETKRKDVPHRTTYILLDLTVHTFGNVSYALDKSTNSLIIFKGKDNVTLDEIQAWLPKNAEEAKAEKREKVVKGTITDIAPLTLFTKQELKRMKKKNAKMVIQLGKYKTVIIADYDPTYVDLLSDNDKLAIKKLKESTGTFEPKVGNY